MLEKFKNMFIKHNILFTFSKIYIFLMIVIPKTYSTFSGIIPIRLTLSCFLILTYIFDYYFLRDKYHKTPKILMIVYLMFLLFSIPSIFKSKAVITTIYTIMKFISYFLIFILFLTRKFSTSEYKKIRNVFCVSLLTVLIYGIIQNIFGFGLQTIGIEKYSPSKGRTVSCFFNTIYFGIFINLMIPFLINKINMNDNKRKFFYSIVLLISFSLLLSTYTRSAFLIFCGIIAILFILNYKIILNKFVISTLMLCLIISMILPGANKLIYSAINSGFSMISRVEVLKQFLPDIFSNSDLSNNLEEADNDEYSDSEKVDDNTDSGKTNDNTGSERNEDNDDDFDTEKNETPIFEDLSLEHRKEFANISNRIANDNKYTGIGLGTYIDYMKSNEFKIKYSDYKLSITHPHSSLVLLYSEVGIIAQFSYILFFILILLHSMRLLVLNFKDKSIYSFCVALFACIVGFVTVNIISENAIYDTQISYIFYSIIGLSFNYIKQHTKNLKKILFISSTGGHLSELSQLKSMLKKYDFNIITEKTKSTLFLKKKYGKKVDYLMYGTKDKKFIYPFKLLFNCIKSLFLYFKIRPNYIITTGTHTAVPMCYIGKLFGSKIIFIETFANVKTKTLSGRIVYPIADLFIVQWAEMLKLYPKAIYNGYIY